MSNDARWLPDPTRRHELRYWDGVAWTENVSDDGRQSTDPLAAAPQETQAVASSAAAVSPSGGGRTVPVWGWVLIGFVVLGVIGALTSGDESKDDLGSQTQTQTQTQTTTTEAAAPPPTPTVEIAWESPEETTRDEVTLKGTVTSGARVKVSGHRASVVGTRWTKVVRIKQKGENTWRVTATKKGYDSSGTDAIVTRKLSASERAAIRRAQVRRRANARALAAAESYLALSGMSKKGLYRQLSSEAGEGFTAAEAQYAVDHVDADWKQEAVESARSYLEISPMSRSELLQQLSSDAGEGFTYEEAVYAVNKVY